MAEPIKDLWIILLVVVGAVGACVVLVESWYLLDSFLDWRDRKREERRARQ